MMECTNTTKSYIVAELSSNHHKSYAKAVDLIYAAYGAGANAIKVQMYTPDCMALDTEHEHFLIKDGLWKGRRLYELYKEASMPVEWVPDMLRVAHKLDLGFIASIYHPKMIDIAEEYNVPVYKIASFEINNKELIKAIAVTGKPVIVSTGMAEESEIQFVVI